MIPVLFEDRIRSNTFYAMANNQKNQTTIIGNALLNGVAGCFGVACQTAGLLWHFNLKEERVRTGLKITDTAVLLYRTGGLGRFYHGFFSAFRSASMARFGDNFFSSLITKELDKNKLLKNSTIFVKSAFVWAFASTWRLALLPFDALDQVTRSKLAEVNKMTYSQLRKTIKRLYLKRSKPEIISLYFWFVFHMFCDKISHPMAFKDNLPLFIGRNAVVGFGSMVFYDLMLDIWRRTQRSTVNNQCYSVLLGECNGRTLMKGMHGMMFCTFSNLFKLCYGNKGIIF